MSSLDELLGITEEDREWASRSHPRWCCGRMAPIGFEKGRDTCVSCRNDCCTEERCECGSYMGGWGIAGCDCQDGGVLRARRWLADVVVIVVAGVWVAWGDWRAERRERRWAP